MARAASQARSPAGRAFARYLDGAEGFYAGRYDDAAAAFSALRTAPSPWLQDTAAYMRARTEVNRLQVGAFDPYGAFLGPEHVSRPAAASAETALRTYLQERPRGAYAGSARGLLRRVDWLAGRGDRLAAAYAALIAQPPRARGLGDADLAEEIDDKLLTKFDAASTGDPVLLAVDDLRNMRPHGGPQDKDCRTGVIPLARLEAQRKAFAAAPALFDLLLAVHAFYVEHDPASVLRLIPDETHAQPGSSVWFSRQVLRGMALERVGDRNARGFWVELLPGARRAFEPQTVELAIASHDERARALPRVFEAGSPVRDPAVRRILLADGADAALLRRQAGPAGESPHEREVALYVLLYKEVTRGRFRDFGADLALAPADAPLTPAGSTLTDDGRPALGVFTHGATSEAYPCPALAATARALAADPRAAKAALCLAEWVRLNDLDGDPLDAPPPKDELGGAPSLFPGPAYARMTTYRALMAGGATPPEERAYALFRAVNCYAPSGANRCGGPQVDKAERKAWFTRLKSAYPTSRWAKELRYWW